MRKVIIGIMGPGQGAREVDRNSAYQLGQQIAREGWVLLTGGRNLGVMEAASQGAKQEDGLTIGILPTADVRGISTAVDLAIFTDMGNARNSINVLSSEVVIACGMGAGTASEVALALKSGKPVILLNCDGTSQAFFLQLSPDKVWIAESPEMAIEVVKKLLSDR